MIRELHQYKEDFKMEVVLRNVDYEYFKEEKTKFLEEKNQFEEEKNQLEGIIPKLQSRIKSYECVCLSLSVALVDVGISYMIA